jgi:hypothetical protein
LRRSTERSQHRHRAGRNRFGYRRKRRLGCIAGIVILVAAVTAPWCIAQDLTATVPPNAPEPNVKSEGARGPDWPCQVRAAGQAASLVGAASAFRALGYELPPAHQPTAKPGSPTCPSPGMNWYKRFTNGPQVKPLTPKEKAWLALRDVVDPFNLVTILADSAIAVGSDAHSPYGPGMAGFARNVGVSFTQDMTGEFINVFAIPSVVHQDPHYHRMPHASIPRRAGHAVLQVLWTQGDNGKGMLNYGNLLGFAIDDEIGNLYVPNRETNLPASAERYAIGLASAPIDHFFSEFVPDVASHIHVQIVVIQRIINQVAKTSPADAP